MIAHVVVEPAVGAGKGAGTGAGAGAGAAGGGEVEKGWCFVVY